MSINSTGFLVFLAAALIVYYLVPRRLRWVLLLCASAVFYLSGSVRAAGYLCITIVLTYAAARGLDFLYIREKQWLAACSKEEKPAVKKRSIVKRRLLLGSALTVNFFTLALFKYLDSLFAGANRLFAVLHLSFQFRPLNLLLPLGISFYIFQTAGYLIDVYRGKARAQKNLLKYALFVGYFPQMVQGPINRYGQLHDQLLAGKPFDAANIRDGIQLMIWGMLKKVFIADVLAAGVSEIYAGYTAYSGLIVFFGAALYCLQLYADFSGGTDIVRGASTLFGIELAVNFKRPYFSRNIDEFWRRWHISLGEWMKDYLFYPLALSKGMAKFSKRLRRPLGDKLGKLFIPCVATIIVFCAVGVWQGPGLSNLAYGLWNGLLISGAMVFAPLFESWNKKLHIKTQGKLWGLFCMFRTCFLVVIGRYFSRALSFTDALGMLRQTVTRLTWNLNLHSFFSFGLNGRDYLTVLLAALVLLFVSWRQEKGVKIRKSLSEKPWPIQFAVMFAAVFLLVVFVYLNSDYTAIAYVYENV